MFKTLRGPVIAIVVSMAMASPLLAARLFSPGNFTKTVTTAGTAEALSTTVADVTGFCVQPLSSNTGIVYLGDSAVDSTNGYVIDSPFCRSAGHAPQTFESYKDRFSLGEWFIDVSVNGEGVLVIYDTFN